MRAGLRLFAYESVTIAASCRVHRPSHIQVALYHLRALDSTAALSIIKNTVGQLTARRSSGGESPSPSVQGGAVLAVLRLHLHVSRLHVSRRPAPAPPRFHDSSFILPPSSLSGWVPLAFELGDFGAAVDLAGELPIAQDLVFGDAAVDHVVDRQAGEGQHAVEPLLDDAAFAGGVVDRRVGTDGIGG